MYTHHSVTTNNEKELLTTEGTVFVHVTYAIKQDTQLRKEYLKMLKVCVHRSSTPHLAYTRLEVPQVFISLHCLHPLHIVCKKFGELFTYPPTPSQTAQERLSSGEVSLFSVTLALSAVSIHKLEETVRLWCV